MHFSPLILAGSLLLPLLCCAAAEETATEATDAAAPETARFAFSYQAAVRELPEGAERVRVWIPLPIATPDQEVGELTISVSHGASVSLHDFGPGGGRVLYAESAGEPIELRYDAKITRRSSGAGRWLEASDMEQQLRADAMIPLSGKVAEIAAELELPEQRMDAGKALYTHTLDRMRYDKPAGERWGRGDAEWACDSRFGNCTDFHSYFIGLARARAIPARFVMGFPVPGPDAGEQAEIGGYHCWAWFWGGDDRGWVPVDISEADKHPERAAFYFGQLDPWRVALVQGRDHELSPAPDNGPLNLFIYPYVEVDGAVHDAVEKRFSRTLLE